MKISHGFEEIEIFPSHKCPYCITHSHSFTRVSARFFLQRFKTDHMAMESLRRMVREGGYDLVAQISDDEVLERVAGWLARGELHVIWKPLIFGTGAAKTASEGRPQVQAPPPPPSKAEGPPVPAPDEPVFDPDADPDAIANVLTHAAVSGKPFCAE